MATWLPGFVEGVFIEVLWDVERIVVAGRREGERLLESVWWRGEVTEVSKQEGRTLAKIKYDSREEFESQVGTVRVFPQHVQVTDGGEDTQLRWRYYESSGDVRYDIASSVHDEVPQDFHAAPSFRDDTHVLRLTTMQESMEDLKGRVDQVESLALSQVGIYSRVMGSKLHAERSCERLFASLRQKLAIVVQKPLASYKRTETNDACGNLFDLSCASSIRTSVDCSIEEFEFVCRAVSSVRESAYFRVDKRPFTPSSESLRASITVAEILFNSLCGLCEAVGICDEKDILNIAQRERHVSKKGSLEDGVILVAGSFLVDNDEDDTPPAILVCHSVHDGMPAERNIDVLTRDSRILDPRTVWYKHPLRMKTMTVLSLLRHVFPEKCTGPCATNCKEKLIAMSIDDSCFALRWKALSNPSPKEWSRKMIMRPDSAGTLELDIPYVIIRGMNAVNEMKELITASFMKK